jgi:hypothetical protein
VNSQYANTVKNEGFNRAARIAEINLTGPLCPFLSRLFFSILLCELIAIKIHSVTELHKGINELIPNCIKVCRYKR